MEEYRTLRTELINHVGAQGNLLTFGGVAVAVVAGLKGSASASFWVAMLGILLVGGHFYWTRINSIVRIGRHVSGIEKRINDLARTAHGCDSPLLSWETTQQEEPLRLVNP